MAELGTDVLGLVLCGGKSARMGRDKALEEFEGRSFLARSIETLRPLTREVLLACGSAPRYQSFGCALVLDACPDAGPLAGLAAGLEAARRQGAAYALVCACDMPLGSRALFAALLARARATQADICLTELESGVEPLLGVYATALAAPARAALERGERRVVSFFGDPLHGRALRLERLVPADRAQALGATNVNTPEDLQRLHRARGNWQRSA